MTKEPSREIPACALCHYYHEHSASAGDCHRYPPVFVGADTANERHRWKHPMVPHHNWCGEFHPRSFPGQCAGK